MLKLLSLNMEGNKHLERIFPLVEAERPDVICFQEVFEQDLPLLTERFGMNAFFVPGVDVNVDNPHLPTRGPLGVAQFTALPVVEQRAEYYVGTADRIPNFFENENPNSMNRALVVQTMKVGADEYTIGTTHFTWSMEGEYTPEQQRDFESLRKVLAEFDEVVLCGDFNSPRNRPVKNVYNSLAAEYHDAIPVQYQTSVDSALHKSGKQITLMVDGLFLSPHYQATNVKLVDQVSDHMAIVAEISRK